VIRIALITVFTVLLLAAPADAVLVYQAKEGTHPVVVAARDDGSHARVVAHGYRPQVSPRGRLIAYFQIGDRTGNRLNVVGTHGDHRHLLASRTDSDSGVAWSPDDRYLTVAPSLDFDYPVRLVDVRKGTTKRMRADAEYAGAGWTPDGTALTIWSAISSSSGVTDFLTHVKVASGERQPLDEEGAFPLWSRHGLAFEGDSGGLLLKKHLDEGPETLLAREAYPVGWSANGNRLLAWEHSRFAQQAVLIDLSPRTIRRVKEPVFPTALSHDGKKVLGEMNGDVVERSGNGTVKVLARDATSPSWTK
jgi:hypothetical protein